MQDLRAEMVLTMEALGIQIEAHHHEVATAGQAEITTLTRADNLMMYKYVVKNMARKHGMTAAFMPKPTRVQSGSSFVRPILPAMDIWRLQRC